MMAIVDEAPGGFDWGELWANRKDMNTPILWIGGQGELDSALQAARDVHPLG